MKLEIDINELEIERAIHNRLAKAVMYESIIERTMTDAVEKKMTLFSKEEISELITNAIKWHFDKYNLRELVRDIEAQLISSKKKKELMSNANK